MSAWFDPVSELAFVVGGRELGRIVGGYRLDMTGDVERRVDRRLAVAAFVSLALRP